MGLKSKNYFLACSLFLSFVFHGVCSDLSLAGEGRNDETLKDSLGNCILFYHCVSCSTSYVIVVCSVNYLAVLLFVTQITHTGCFLVFFCIQSDVETK